MTALARKDWRFSIPATLEAAEEIFGKFRDWRVAVCSELSSFPAELLFREALTNSVVHGCREDPEKTVHCVLRVKPGRLVIAIQDGGPGFDWRSAWMREAPLSQSHGRGMEIYRRYASLVRFGQAGNSVVLIKRF